MTDEGRDGRKWFDDAEEALNRTSEALRAAWEESRGARMSTLESAKEAANRLGRAIDQGIAAARQTWDSSDRDDTQDQSNAEEE